METRNYVGYDLNKDIEMCKIFDELKNNPEVIILHHGRNVLINEMKYKDNISNDRISTGKTHIGFDYHYITIYYRGTIFNIEPALYYPFTDINHPGRINAVPYIFIPNNYKQQAGYSFAFNSLKDLEKYEYKNPFKDVPKNQIILFNTSKIEALIKEQNSNFLTQPHIFCEERKKGSTEITVVSLLDYKKRITIKL